MSAREDRGVDLAQIAQIRRTWPPAIDVSCAAKPLGVSRSSAYASIANGTFPVATIRVGRSAFPGKRGPRDRGGDPRTRLRPVAQ